MHALALAHFLCNAIAVAGGGRGSTLTSTLRLRFRLQRWQCRCCSSLLVRQMQPPEEEEQTTLNTVSWSFIQWFMRHSHRNRRSTSPSTVTLQGHSFSSSLPPSTSSSSSSATSACFPRKLGFVKWSEFLDLCRMRKFEDFSKLLDAGIDEIPFLNERAVLEIVERLCKAGKIDAGQQLVDALSAKWPMQMTKVYGVWVEHLVRNDRASAAHDFLERKHLEGLRFHPRCYSVLLRGLLKKKKMNRVCELLVKMKDNDVFPDQRIMNAAVQGFSRAKFVDVALSLYNQRRIIALVPSCRTYAVMVYVLSTTRRLDEAYKVLLDAVSAGHFPPKSTMYLLATDLSKAGKYDLSCTVVDLAMKNGFLPDRWAASRIISNLCEAGRVDEAYGIIGKLRKMNVVLSKSAYASVVDGYCDLRRADVAYNLLLEMQQMGHMPSRFTLFYVYCILCEAGGVELALNLIDKHMCDCPIDTKLYNKFIKIVCDSGRPEIAVTVIEKMLEKGITPDVISYINLLHGFLKSRSVVNAMNFFQELSCETECRNRLYNVMVSGLCNIQRLDLALAFFQDMNQMGLVPSHGCFVKLIRALCNQDKFNLALKFFEDMKRKGYQPRTFTYNVLIGHSFKMREVNQAWFLFDEMRKNKCPPNVSTFTILIAGLSRAKRLESAISALEEILEQFFTADILIYNMLLRGLCREGKMELACELLSRMPKQGCVPNADSYNSLIIGLCQSGRFIDAQKIASQMLEKGLLTPNKLTLQFLQEHFSKVV